MEIEVDLLGASIKASMSKLQEKLKVKKGGGELTLAMSICQPGGIYTLKTRKLLQHGISSNIKLMEVYPHNGHDTQFPKLSFTITLSRKTLLHHAFPKHPSPITLLEIHFLKITFSNHNFLKYSSRNTLSLNILLDHTFLKYSSPTH